MSRTQEPPVATETHVSRRSLAKLGATIGVLAICAIGVTLLVGGAGSTAPVSGFQIVNAYPHDPQAFCQGLVFENGQLFEGTGQNGTSSLRLVELETGRVLKHVPIDRRYFAEGITLLNESIYQLTWRARQAFVFDRDTLAYKKTFRYRGEGWGLTHDGTHLIMSDGSSTLRFFDPETFTQVRRLPVRDGRTPISKLNELEFVKGEILANIWYSDRIARISPDDGRVLGWIDLALLWPKRQRPSREHVLNGIAYDEAGDRLFVTGKNWPKLYEIRVVDP